MKKTLARIIISIFLIKLLVLLLIATKIHTNFIVFTDANIENKVSLEINYGQKYTSTYLVIMHLDASTIAKNEVASVQFSYDMINWFGYSEKRGWIANHKGIYQTFYSDFNFGTVTGLKTVYVKVFDKDNNLLATSSDNIYFMTEETKPIINRPITNQSGSGTMSRPFFTASRNVMLNLDTINSSEFTYTFDNINWKKWQRVHNDSINKRIVLANAAQTQSIKIKTRNKFGVESESTIIYFKIDRTPPKVAIVKGKNNLVANNGELSFDITLYDNTSDIIYYQIFIERRGIYTKVENQINIVFENKTVYNEINISNLIKGTHLLKIVAHDRAGNFSRITVGIDSI